MNSFKDYFHRISPERISPEKTPPKKTNEESKNVKYRVRDRNIHIMVTSYEYELIYKKMKASGKKTLREFLIECAINAYIIKVDYTELNNLIHEVNKIGVNINQIAHKVNSTDSVCKADIDILNNEINSIWKLLRSKLLLLN